LNQACIVSPSSIRNGIAILNEKVTAVAKPNTHMCKKIVSELAADSVVKRNENTYVNTITPNGKATNTAIEASRSKSNAANNITAVATDTLVFKKSKRKLPSQ